ncbi:MAG: Hpt domain-containing protein [Allorhizobium sp.]
MAALNIAFDAPDNAAGRCPSNQRPIDLVHLATMTMGDKVLEIEVLQMFARQARGALTSLVSENSGVIMDAAHRLKGAAAAVGAFKVSAAAQALEDTGVDAGKIAAVGDAVIEAENFILKLCR